MNEPKPRLRWYQYRLRTLLVFVTLCALPCTWIAVTMKQARRQREAVAAIRKLGGGVTWGEPSGRGWLRGVLGDDFFNDVLYLNLNGTQITDAGLQHLAKLSQLQILWLGGTQITDTGLQNLAGLSQLQSLLLHDTKITDAGLQHLIGLSQLQILWLQGTNVTDEGVKKLPVYWDLGGPG